MQEVTTPLAGENWHSPTKDSRTQDSFYPGKYSMVIPKMCSLLDAGRKILLIHTGLIYMLEHPPIKIISPTTHSPSAKNSQQRTPAVSIPLPSSINSSARQVHEPPTRNHLKCRVTTAVLTRPGSWHSYEFYTCSNYTTDVSNYSMLIILKLDMIMLII